ncbi:alpha-mannosidase [Mycetocola sp. CAN_C7]|uniref:alpha-mannosidase n=1 Tax=Mycetocola sp. CAN_C7 TaxID=2787724 RepID=UPI0018CA79BD
MHQNHDKAFSRIDRFRRDHLAPAIHRDRVDLTVARWDAPGEPVTFAEASAQEYTVTRTGASWGLPWGTSWFEVTGSLPGSWRDHEADGSRFEASMDLGFNLAKPGFQSEGLVWRPDGQIVKGLEPRNHHVPVSATAGDEIHFYVEAASNPDFSGGNDFKGADAFAPTPYGDLASAPDQPLYRLGEFTVAVIDLAAERFHLEVQVLAELAAELPALSPRRADILRALENAIALLDPDDIRSGIAAATDCLRPVLDSPAATSAHRLVATGHAHIDSAWLWPTRETVRKIARTFSNVLDRMDEDDNLLFVASSAQQYAWVKASYPELFERVRARVAEGRFIPVGGMWVEADTNMPGGEALIRQFLLGTEFFRAEFGIETQGAWLPDSFGYSAALPQIIRGVGANWFFTQKLCWNDTDDFPHSTFFWEGNDGTRILSHQTPVNTYSSDVTPRELFKAERNFREHGAASTSLLPFGFGDGGGGPTREMLERIELLHDLDGSPTIEISTPDAFFEHVRDEYTAPPVWAGELYLEFHRGVFTSQARTKHGNRRSEHLLREAELWATTALVRAGVRYPYDELESAWQTVLLQQFHDILPGSAIAWVHREAERKYAEVAQTLDGIIASSLRALAGDGDLALTANTSPFAVNGVASGAIAPAELSAETVSVEQSNGGYVLANAHLQIRTDAAGLVASVIDRSQGRELVPTGTAANLLQLHVDTPSEWDAWNIDPTYRASVRDLTALDGMRIEHGESGSVSVVVERSFSRSTATQRITLRPGAHEVGFETTVDWHEQNKLLKLAFPLDIHTDRFASETAFGHVWRPTHTNTTWDDARFEVCAHRWVHVEEPGFGVGIVNDATYGHDVTRVATDAGTPATVVRQSLLRAALFPDPAADEGVHSFRGALVVGGILESSEHGYRLNGLTRAISGSQAVTPLIRSVGETTALVEWIKPAQDRSGDLIVRLAERVGGRTTARIQLPESAVLATLVDLLERPLTATGAGSAVGTDLGIEPDGRQVTVRFQPFEIVTLRITLS